MHKDVPHERREAGLRTVDLFCGCGGLSRGMMDAGFDVRLGIDWDEDALETYRNNLDHTALRHDLTDWEGAVGKIRERLPVCDVIVGSPPCTEFSRAGNQVEGGVASLTVSFARVVTSILPDFFIMENVPDVAQSSSLATAVSILTASGYSVASFVKDARHVGVPQARRRLFLVGCAATVSNERRLADIVKGARDREAVVGVKEYCRNVGVYCPDFLYFFPRNKFQAHVVDADLVYPTMRSTHGVCMNKNPLTPGYVRRPNDAAELSEAATITIPLASAISSFPPDFKWPDNRRLVGKQLGNCVPPGLAAWVGRLVARHMLAVETLPHEVGAWVLKPEKSVPTKTSHRALFFRRIHENGGDCTHASVRITPLVNTRTGEGAFRSLDVAQDPCQISYEVGSSKEIDAAASTTMGFPLRAGWTFIIKERICQRSRIDDLFVSVPGQKVPFRGKALLVKNGLL